MIRPEKLVDYYIKHPSAAAMFAANKPIDAGRAMTLTNNIGHLIEQDAGHIIWSTGQAFDFLPSNTLPSFTGDIARDGAPPSASGATLVANQIGWTDRTALRWGPFFVIADEGDSSVNAKPRKVRLIASFNPVGAIAHSKMCAAITRGSSPQEILEGRALAYSQINVAPTDNEARFSLVPDVTIDATTPYDRTIPATPESYGDATQTPVRTFYVWLAWAMYSASPGSFVLDSVSGYEYR